MNASIQFLLDNGISTGQNPKEKNNLLKYFGYTNDLTRAQVVTFLYRMHNNGLNQVSNSAKSSLNMSKHSSLNELAKQSITKIHKELAPKKNPVKTTSTTVTGGLTPKAGLTLTYNPSLLHDGKEVFNVEKRDNVVYLRNSTHPKKESFYYIENNESLIMGVAETDWQFFIFSYPMKQGDSIKDSYFDNQDYKKKYKKVLVESTTKSIKVKAGTFDHVVILRYATGERHYFAKGIGLIKSTDQNGKVVTELSAVK